MAKKNYSLKNRGLTFSFIGNQSVILRMKKTFLVIFLVPAIFFSCKEKKDTTPTAAQDEKKSYFPVADFLRGQIHSLDSMPVAFLQIIIAGNKSDSSYIKQPEFHQLAQNFIFPETAPGVFEKKFKENLFLDQTTKSATFNYTATDSGSALNRIDVLATPDELISKVSSVFMQESTISNDTSIVRKLLWQTNKEFEIIQIVQVPNKPKAISQRIVIWNVNG
jgi:hypothetical protein